MKSRTAPAGSLRSSGCMTRAPSLRLPATRSAELCAGTRCAFVPGSEPYPNQFPFRAGGNQVLKIWFQINDVATVQTRIYSLDGMLVRHLDDSSDSLDTCSASAPEKCNQCNSEEGCVWDGTTYEGGSHFVSNGMYIVNIHATCHEAFPGGTIDYTKGIVVMK